MCTERFLLSSVVNLQTLIAVVGWYHQFETIGCLCQGKSTGRPRLTEESVDRVRDFHTQLQEREISSARWSGFSNARDDCLESSTKTLRTTFLSSEVATSSKTDRL
ncbi:hypothetical protein TNCV_2210731 [Trichonephila clavipes]|nr:hypothetical protein TNCV_2210731 [Trichonephila clavipes]